jgi:uroporphyrinogen-III synthase
VKPVVLVTRPAEEALRTALALAEHGYDFLIDPLLEITPLPDAAERLAQAGDAVALLFTSANGVRAYAAATPSRDLPVYAVGRITSDAARAVGFARIETAGGDSALLAGLVARVLRPESGALLHVAGEHVAGDLAGALAAKGFTVRTASLYTATAATALSQKTRDTLAQGGLGAVLFFSPRTARTFVSLVRTAGLEAYCRSTVAVCLSGTVAEAALGLEWRGVATAKKPGDDPLGGAGIGVVIDALMQALPGEGAGEEKTGGQAGMADTDKKTIALPAGEVIQRFGGIRPMASKLGISFSTVQGWKERGHIPEARHGEILALAASQGVKLDAPPAAPPAESPTAPPLSPRPAAAPPDRPPPMPPPLVAQAVPPPASRGIGAMGAAFISLVVAALVIAGAYFTREHWLGEIAAPSMPAPTQPSVDRAVLDAFAARLAKIERDAAQRPASPGAAPAPDPKLADSLAELDKRLTDLQAALQAQREQSRRDAQAATASLSDVAQAARAAAADQAKASSSLAQRVEALEKGFDPAAFVAIRNGLNELGAKLDAMGKRLEAAEKTAASARAEGLAQAAFALSVGQIRRAVEQGAPFAAELAASRSLAGGDAAYTASLDQLAPLAAQGVATRAALAQSLRQTAAGIVHAGRQRDAETGAWRRFLAWLDSLITIRPVGAAGGDSPAARAARGEAMLASGDLAGAVAQLEALGAPAADAAKPWIARAKARLQAEQALAALETRAAAAVARK